MPYCSKCKISVSSKADKCPLCHRNLYEDFEKVTEDYPGFQPFAEKRGRLARTVSIIACALIIMSVAGNILMLNKGVWCVVFSACVLYTWGLGLLTFSKRIHLGWKLTAHAIVMPLLLIVINVFASSARAVERATWAVSYTLPAIIVAFIIALDIIIIIWNRQRHEYLFNQLSLCVIGFVPLVLVLCGVARPVYPSIAAAGCSLSTLIWLFVFEKKVISAEFARKFHI